MAQIARPDSDVSSSIYWSGSYTLIDEVTPDDGDYLTCGNNGNGTTEKGLSNVGDPGSSADHIVRFRAWQSQNTKQRGLTVTLVQGSTVIATYATGDLIRNSPTAYSFTLTGDEADSITDYSDLRLRFTSTGDVGTPTYQRAYVYVSWAEFEVPEAEEPTARVSSRSVEVAWTVGTPVLVSARAVEVAWKVSFVTGISSRLVEVAWTQGIATSVSHRVVEVAWSRTVNIEVSQRVLEVAILRSGRIYGVAIGHF